MPTPFTSQHTHLVLGTLRTLMQNPVPQSLAEPYPKGRPPDNTREQGETRKQHQERKWLHLGACGDAQAAFVALNSRIKEFVLISYG